MRSRTLFSSISEGLGSIVATLDNAEATRLAREIKYMPNVRNYICSYGTCLDYRKEVFEQDTDYAPFVEQCDGVIFTDQKQNHDADQTVNFYNNQWMPSTCIGADGDKGQVAQLLSKPTILFDDQEDNIDTHRTRAFEHCPLLGYLVRRRRNRYRHARHGYPQASDCDMWLGIVKDFDEAHSSKFDPSNKIAYCGSSDNCHWRKNV